MSTTWRIPLLTAFLTTSHASRARRFGRKPNEQSRKLASKIGSKTILAAVCTTRSLTRGIERGRRSFGRPGFGIMTLRDAWGR
jgi:hypothetical protein